MNAELVTARHLNRKAVIYIRQSSPHQVLTNQESLRLQYALQQRACELGWQEGSIEVIDADLGLSGAAAEHRRGFKELIARVTLGEVGLVLSSEVTRLARNCSDWYPLLDLCGYRACLIADRDGVYDPGSLNGRLLLGLKGTMSEVELHLLRGRLTAGLLSKAARGELGLMLPAGLERDADGRVIKDPDREVQDRLTLVFTTFLEQGSVAKVMRSFRSRQLTVPRRDRFGAVAWRAPTTGMLGGILKNPAYAGAFVYGRTRSCHRHYASGRLATTRCPMSAWKIVVQGKYPAYLDWDSFERIQAMLRDNYAEYLRRETRGTPRDGAALLQGIAWCGECGHKLVVQYCNGNRYACTYLQHTQGAPMCQHLPADPPAEPVEAQSEPAEPPGRGEVAADPVRVAAHLADRDLAYRHDHVPGEKAYFDARQIPSVAYTDPEVAWAGITEDDAKKQGLKYTVGKFPWAASGRAIANGRDEGFTKLIFDEETHRILGGGIVGTHAGDLIGEVCLAVEMGADMIDIGKTIHPHPTLGESVGMAAEIAHGTCTDVPPVRKK